MAVFEKNYPHVINTLQHVIFWFIFEKSESANIYLLNFWSQYAQSEGGIRKKWGLWRPVGLKESLGGPNVR